MNYRQHGRPRAPFVSGIVPSLCGIQIAPVISSVALCACPWMQIYDTALIAAHPAPLNHPPRPRGARSLLLLGPSLPSGWHG